MDMYEENVEKVIDTFSKALYGYEIATSHESRIVLMQQAKQVADLAIKLENLVIAEEKGDLTGILNAMK